MTDKPSNTKKPEPALIGQGLQFAVYDEGNKVRKRPNSNREILRLLTRSNLQSVVNPLGLGREARRIARERDDTIKQFSRRVFDRGVVANATLRGRTIVQDKVTPLGEMLKQSREPQTLIQQYIDFTRNTWRQGVCETSFNFTINNGLTPDGQVVITDIGELCFDKDVVARHIRELLWEKCWSVEHDLDTALRSWVLETFREQFTLSVLDDLWVDAPVESEPS